MATNMQKVMEYALNPVYRGLPQQYNGLGEAVEPNCGDILKIALTVNEREWVVEAGYMLTETACPTLFACAAAAITLAADKPALAAYAINQDTIANLLAENGDLDEEHRHCAIMAELSLKRAVVDYARNRAMKQ